MSAFDRDGQPPGQGAQFSLDETSVSKREAPNHPRGWGFNEGPDFWVERSCPNPAVTLFALRRIPTVEAWDAFLREATLWLLDLEKRGVTTAVVIDASELVSVDARARRAIGEWRATHLPLIANVCTCAGYVADRVWMRGVLIALFWMAPPSIPVQVFADRQKALAWTALGPCAPRALLRR